MKGYRFITDDDTVDFCQRVTEAIFSLMDGNYMVNQK